MVSSAWRRNVEDSLKDGLIITAATTIIFLALKTANVKPPFSLKFTVESVEGYW